MNDRLLAAILLVFGPLFGSAATDVSKTIYDFKAFDANYNEISLDKYRGKVVLIVNVASECGLTNTNYNQLKQLYDKYSSRGLAIAAFPCNQFGGQEPGSEDEIKRFIKNTFNFEPDLYAKVDVNGPTEHPLYAFLKEQQGGTLGDDIKWNFTKFLVDRNGQVVNRYAPTTQPNDIEDDIVKLLNEHADL